MAVRLVIKLYSTSARPASSASMREPQQQQKSLHLSSCLNTGNESAFCVDDDRLFHTRGPATQNARSPIVDRRALGMPSLAEAEDRSLLHDSNAVTGCSWSARYGGAVPWRKRSMSTASLN